MFIGITTEHYTIYNDMETTAQKTDSNEIRLHTGRPRYDTDKVVYLGITVHPANKKKVAELARAQGISISRYINNLIKSL